MLNAVQQQNALKSKQSNLLMFQGMQGQGAVGINRTLPFKCAQNEQFQAFQVVNRDDSLFIDNILQEKDKKIFDTKNARYKFSTKLKVDKNSKLFLESELLARLKVEDKETKQMKFSGKTEKGTVKATKNFSKYANIGVEMQPDGKAPLTAILSKVVTLPSGKKVRLVIKAQSDAEIRARHKETNEIAEIRMGNPEVYNGKYEKRTPFYMEHLASKQKLGFSGKNVQLATIAAYRPEITNEMVKKSLTEYVDKACTKETKGKYHDEIAKNRDKFTVYILLGGIGSRYKPTCAKGLNKPADPAASEFPLGFLGGIRAVVDAGLIDKEQAKKDILSGNIAMANVSNPENKPNGKENTSSILMLEGSFGQNTAGALVSALQRGLISDDKHIVVLSGDQIHDIDLSIPLKKQLEQKTGSIIIAQPKQPFETVNTFGLIGVGDEDARNNLYREDIGTLADVKSFEEKPKEESIAEAKAVRLPMGNREALANTGIYLFSPEDVKKLKNSVKDGEGIDFGNDFLPSLTGSLKVAISQNKSESKEIPAIWQDVGNFKEFRKTLEYFGDPNFSKDFRFLPKPFIEQVASNTDKGVGVVCKTAEAKEALLAFENEFSLQGRGDIIVMAEEVK